MRNLFFLLLVSMGQPVLAQTKLEKAITNLEKNYQQEKVYLLTDKTQYAAGTKYGLKVLYSTDTTVLHYRLLCLWNCIILIKINRLENNTSHQRRRQW